MKECPDLLDDFHCAVRIASIAVGRAIRVQQTLLFVIPQQAGRDTCGLGQVTYFHLVSFIGWHATREEPQAASLTFTLM
ncbi:hypothetical protein ASF98_21815 [Arthrobacter sp. Leaf337]|nr:hypothetical protein ASF98_21815 [Arthrobacter sp. Leaf337]